MSIQNEARRDEVPQTLVRVMERQKYHKVGNHSGVKTCSWLHESLVHGRACYKEKFYGIKSHRCLQMTPALYSCTQRCLFCWRAQTSDLKLDWNETGWHDWDGPDAIVENSFETQRNLLSGYRGNPNVDHKKLREAYQPTQVAISLTGEPTLYPHIGELLQAYEEKRCTTFLVTNGSLPQILARLNHEPTQLYVSVPAPTQQLLKGLCRPAFSDSWDRLEQTLSLLSVFKCPTVMRITLLRGVNLETASEYAKLVTKANPTYIEAKAYMYVGFSRQRLKFESMPNHQEIRQFAAKLAEETSYNVIAESDESRVVLLSVLNKAIRFD